MFTIGRFIEEGRHVTNLKAPSPKVEADHFT